MAADSFALRLADESATAALGVALADVLLALSARLSEQGLTIGLTGELGAGKTALVRALLRRSGETGTVKSPTFSLLEPYELSRLHFYHFDFYRFKNPEEFQDRGFAEYFGPGGACIVEWPEHAAGYLPVLDLGIALRVEPLGAPRDAAADPAGEPARRASLEAHTELGKQCLTMLKERWLKSNAGA